MGLVSRRSEQLDRLFDQFAIDPKKKQPVEKPKDDKKKETKEDDK
ncbi:MAG: SPJ_0845 family protein [Limosilactobacillus sp.]|nr:SPJ_0845 family protein [Limosilactobacillus sp.]